MSVCPSCNAPFPDGFSFCPKCGAATPSSVAVSEADTVVAPTGGSAKSIGRVQRAVGDEYRVERLVGQGGFAEVFAAHDPRLKRTVAIKVLRPDLIVNQELVDRFQREAEAIAGLRHPNIMQIYTVGERDGVAYFVMPFVEGQSLREVIDAEGRLSLFEAKRIAIDAAKALAAAHAKGLVHRDVKPDNIMLEGEERHVLLTDFGIARAVASGETRITGTGMIIGTPQYMSPEQAAGDEDIDHRTDIYSLGVVIYQMITGALPFKGTSIQALIASHMTEEPQPVKELRPDCDPALASVVERCLRKDPAERFVASKELVDAIDSGAVLRSSRPMELAFATPQRQRRRDRTDDPVASFRKTVIGLLATSAFFLLVDTAITGMPGLSAFYVVVAVGLGFIRYGRLWTLGYSWHDLFRPSSVVHRPHEPRARQQLSETDRTVRECRSHRAAIVKAFGQMARQEQKLFPTLLETVDELTAKIADCGRRLNVLDNQLKSEQDVLSSGKATSSSAQMHRRLIGELLPARQESKRELDSCVIALAEVRGALTGSSTGGSSLEKVGTYLQRAREKVRTDSSRAT